MPARYGREWGGAAVRASQSPASTSASSIATRRQPGSTPAGVARGARLHVRKDSFAVRDPHDVRQVPKRRPDPRVRVLELGEPALKRGKRVVRGANHIQMPRAHLLPTEPAQLERRIRVGDLVHDARDRLLELRALGRLRVAALASGRAPDVERLEEPADVRSTRGNDAGGRVPGGRRRVACPSTTNNQRGPVPDPSRRTRPARPAPPRTPPARAPAARAGRPASGRSPAAPRSHAARPRTEARPPRDDLTAEPVVDCGAGHP